MIGDTQELRQKEWLNGDEIATDIVDKIMRNTYEYVNTHHCEH